MNLSTWLVHSGTYSSVLLVNSLVTRLLVLEDELTRRPFTRRFSRTEWNTAVETETSTASERTVDHARPDVEVRRFERIPLLRN